MNILNILNMEPRNFLKCQFIDVHVINMSDTTTWL